MLSDSKWLPVVVDALYRRERIQTEQWVLMFVNMLSWALVCACIFWEPFEEFREVREWLTCCKAPRPAARCVLRAAWPSASHQTLLVPKLDDSPATPVEPLEKLNHLNNIYTTIKRNIRWSEPLLFSISLEVNLWSIQHTSINIRKLS